MIPIIFHIIRLIFSFISPSDARERNLLYEAFNKSYETQDCQSAIDLYHNLETEELPISVEIKIKVADCYFAIKDTASLRKELMGLDYVRRPRHKSAILNQKAMLATFAGDTMSAINFLKMAIETENSNNFVKRNYELLKKVYKPNENRPPPPNQQNSSNSANSSEGGIVLNSDEKEDILESTDPPAISRAQALQLLEAMRANEYSKPPLLLGIESDTLNYGNW